MGMNKRSYIGLSKVQTFQKRLFDIVFSLLGLTCTWWIILITWVFSTIDTKKNGFFVQSRIGQYGRLFGVIKIRTMRLDSSIATTVTTSSDPRITPVGAIFRKLKVDELPQLVNVLIGDMSFVGPRPDVPGFADELEGDDRVILTIKPGITGPATLKYRNEEEILQQCEDPEGYNQSVIFPDKVKINREYIENFSLWIDIQYIFRTMIK